MSRKVLVVFGATIIIFTWFASIIVMKSGLFLAEPTINNGQEQNITMQGPHSLNLSSPAFENGKTIPKTYACDGKGISPELIISGTPEAAESLVLVLEDPDAPRGTFIHWLMWNIPKETKVIPEAASPLGVSGLNSADELGYVGPCPPSGTHHYIFKLYALDQTLELPPKSRIGDVQKAMGKNVIDQAQLVGLYQRSI